MFDNEKNKRGMSNAGVGNAIFFTRFKLTAKAIENCLTCAVFAFALPYLVWYWLAAPRDIDVVRFHFLSDFVDPNTTRRWYISDERGERRILTLVMPNGKTYQWLKPAVAKKAVEPLHGALDAFNLIVQISLFMAALGFAIPWTLSNWYGNRSQQDKRVRGAKDIVSATRLSKLVRAKGAGPYKFADVVIPRNAPMRGLLAQGAQGGGKSIAIQDLLLQVLTLGRKCIIYDQSGEYFRAHFRPGKDVFFNPACLGSVPWSIFSELKYSYDADTLAHAFLPKKSGVTSGAGAFFEDAARALFSVLLRKLAEAGAQNTCDLATAFLTLPEADMERLISGTIAASSVGGDSKAQRQGVISSIAIYLNGISTVQPGTWSIRDFIDGPEDSCLYILGSKDTRAMYAPLFRLLLTIAFEAIAAKEDHVHDDKYWFFLDEVHTLGDIKLDEQLATLRKYGVCVVSGVQSDSQFNESMGQDRGAVVMNCFNTVLMLAAHEENMQKRMSARLGMVDVDVVSRNQALAVTESRDGAGLTRMDKEKPLVMPAHFGELDACHGYLKLAGSYPAAEVDYSGWLRGSGNRPRRVDLWKPVNELPSKNPQFEIVRAHTEDVIASITTGMKEELLASALENANTVTSPETATPTRRRKEIGAKYEERTERRQVAMPTPSAAPGMSAGFSVPTRDPFEPPESAAPANIRPARPPCPSPPNSAKPGDAGGGLEVEPVMVRRVNLSAAAPIRQRQQEERVEAVAAQTPPLSPPLTNQQPLQLDL
jgi:hypothetical protein